jgi:hypothetical protein
MKPLGAGLFGVIALMGVRYLIQEIYGGVITSATTDQAAACLSVTGSTTAVEDGNTDIVGTIRNRCDRKFGQVTVSFKISRSSSGWTASTRPSAVELPDAVITAYVRDVQPGETRRFKSSTHVSKNAVFRFDRISGF